jgi:putative SOS response-associated peptidase YedK
MCGRFTYTYTAEEIDSWIKLRETSLKLSKRYNVSTTQNAPVIRVDSEGQKTLELLRWGLIPSWAKEEKIGNSLINARSETIAEKPSFRSAFKSRRCLVPISGFFEWKKLSDGKSKQPYLIFSSEKRPIFIAGLFEHWKSPEGKAVDTFTMVTTTPNSLVAQFHDRMPVILDIEKCETWLNPKASPATLTELFEPCPSDTLSMYEVSTIVNSPKNDVPECVQEIN